MQTQMQVPGQVISQVALGPQQNGNAPNSIGLPSTWPRWQSEQDTSLRRHIVENILQLFKSRKPHVTPEWQQKLPDFVKRLEEALYKNAPSKEEYADLKTLEQRLQSVARRMVPKQQPHSVVTSAPMSVMMPTPGTASNMMPTSGGVSPMMPTPGSTGSLIQPGAGVGGGLNNVKSTSGSNNSVMNIVSHGAGIMMPTPGTSSNMMPIPGHSNMFSMSGSNTLSTSGVSGASYPLDSQQAMGNARNLAQNGPLQSSLGIAVGSQMIPTPGLNTSQGLGMAPVSSAGLGLPHVSGVGTGQLQHQQFGVGPDNHMYDGTQLSGGLANVVQQQRKPGSSVGVVNGGTNDGMIIGNGQHLMSGTANLHTQSAYLGTPQYSSLQLQQHQQRMSQQQQHQRSQNMLIQSPLPNPMALMAGDGSYAMNAADLAGGSFPSGNLASNNLGIPSIANSQAPKMIPVPGLPSQQAQQQQQQQQSNLQQQIQQRNNLQQQQLNNGLASRNQPQQLGQPSNNQSLYNSQGLQTSALGGHKQLDQSPQQPLSSQMQQTSSESQQFTRKHQNLQSQKMNTIQSQPQSQPQPQPHQLPQQQTQQHQQQQGTQAQRQQAIQQHLNRLPKSGPQLLTMVQQQKQGHGQQPQQGAKPQHQHPQQQSQQPQPQQPRVAGATQVSAESQFVQQQEAQQRHLNQASQQSIVGDGAPHHRSLVPSQQQQSQGSQVRQVGGTVGSSISTSSMTTPGQVGGTANGAVPGGSVEPGGPSVDAQRQQQYSKQQRWLLFLRHASKCTASEGQCQITPH